MLRRVAAGSSGGMTTMASSGGGVAAGAETSGGAPEAAMGRSPAAPPAGRGAPPALAPPKAGRTLAPSLSMATSPPASGPTGVGASTFIADAIPPSGGASLRRTNSQLLTLPMGSGMNGWVSLWRHSPVEPSVEGEGGSVGRGTRDGPWTEDSDG